MKTPASLLPALLLLPMVMVAGSLGAASPDEDPQRDSRWLAWYGCWEAYDANDEDASSLLVCFQPLAHEAGVEIQTLVDGEILAVEEIIADGIPMPSEEGGCAGERTAEWSQDRSRVFVSSDLQCAEGVSRTTSGVMALTDDGRQWLEIHAVQAGEQEPILGVRRFVPASRQAMEAQGVEPPARDRQLAVNTLRGAMATPLAQSDVVEAVEVAGPDVARALIAELGHPFQLSAETARELAAQGVPGDVLDVMVAVTYPDRFEIEGVSWHAAQPTPVADDRARAVAPWPAYGRRIPVGYSPFFYDPFYFGSGYFGFGSGFGHFGAFRSRIIVVQPRVRDRRARINPNTGVTSPRPSDRRARPASRARAPSGSDANRVPRATQGNRTPAATSRPTRTRVSPQGTTSNRSGSERRARPRNSRGSGSGSGGGGSSGSGGGV